MAGGRKHRGRVPCRGLQWALPQGEFHGRRRRPAPLAIAKRKGTNAIDITHRVEQKLESLRGSLIPSDVQVSITRNYGETASEKSNELLWHMFLAVLSVSALIWLALGLLIYFGYGRANSRAGRAELGRAR